MNDPDPYMPPSKGLFLIGPAVASVGSTGQPSGFRVPGVSFFVLLFMPVESLGFRDWGLEVQDLCPPGCLWLAVDWVGCTGK